MAAGHSVSPDRWQHAFDELMGRIGARFARVEPRRRARAFVLGLLSGLPRANCWTIAEHTGESTPDGMQHLLARPGPPGTTRRSATTCAATWSSILVILRRC